MSIQDGLKETWPAAPPLLNKGTNDQISTALTSPLVQDMLQGVQKRSWAQSVVSLIPAPAMPAIKQKCLAYDLFHGIKHWQYVDTWPIRHANP